MSVPTNYENYIDVVRGDFGYKIYLKVQDRLGNALPLSATEYGAVNELDFGAWKEGDAESSAEGVCSVADSDAGLCFYIVQEGDFAESGDYMAHVVASFADMVVTAIGLNVRVW